MHYEDDTNESQAPTSNRGNRATNVWLAIIAVILAINCYFNYCSALVYGVKPHSLQTDSERQACLISSAETNSSYFCPHGWYLKGWD